MKLLWKYLRAKAKLLFMLGCFVLIFAGVLFLYEVSPSVSGYAALLCLVLGAVMGIADFLSFQARHRRLCDLQNSIALTLAGLPLPGDGIEEDYQALVQILWDDRRTLESRWEKETGEIIQYFIVWAHQIKTPIAAMRLILQGEDSKESRELEAQLFLIEQYAQMVLAYLRLGSDSTDYLLREYDLEGIVRQGVRKYAPMFIRKKVRLDLSPLSCRVVTDEKWLCFAVEQLLSNAVKYTPAEGAVSIALEGRNTLVIRDTGMGIAPDDLPRIFEKGFTGYNGRRDKRASGVGLYLTRQILEKLGHRITLTSVLGEGTTAKIHFDQSKETSNLSQM